MVKKMKALEMPTLADAFGKSSGVFPSSEQKLKRMRQKVKELQAKKQLMKLQKEVKFLESKLPKTYGQKLKEAVKGAIAKKGVKRGDD